MTLEFRAAATLAALLTLAGCGQSGPLYLPGDPSQVESPASEIPGLESSEEDDEDDGR